MNEKEAREIIDNMSEQELNDFIFFALQEVEKENQKLKTELKKKDKMIDEMAISLYGYANLEVVINCPAEYDENYDLSKCRMNLADRNCINCIKQYFERKVENG